MRFAHAYRTHVSEQETPPKATDFESGWVLVDGNGPQGLDPGCITYSTVSDPHKPPASAPANDSVSEAEMLTDYEVIYVDEFEGSACSSGDLEQGESAVIQDKDEAGLGFSLDDGNFPPLGTDPVRAVEATDGGTQEHVEVLENGEDLVKLDTLDPITKFIILAEIMEMGTKTSESAVVTDAYHLGEDGETAGNSCHES